MRKPTAMVRAVCAVCEVCAGLILAGLLAGCSVLVSGSAVPADADGPRPVPASALRDALLGSATINDIMGASDMTVKDARSRLFDGSPQFPDGECMIAWTPAERSVYAHTGWDSVVAQTLLETPGGATHFVIQALVGFPSRDSAGDFFAWAVAQWMPCGDRTFATWRDGRASDTTWTFDTVVNVDSTLWMTQRQDGGRGWSCQRALRVSNNVAVDVLACKLFAADEAVTIAHGIDGHLPSV